MNTLQNLNGQGENQQFNFKEAEYENFTTVDNGLNGRNGTQHNSGINAVPPKSL